MEINKYIQDANDIQSLVESKGFKVLEELIYKELEVVRKNIEDIDSQNRDFLAGNAKGLLQYKTLITRILSRGEEARAKN